MGVVLHWFLPTNGDSRTDLSLGNAVGAAGSRAVEGGDERAPDIGYMGQIARSAEQLGFTGALTPTSSWCEDAWVMTAALTQVTTRFKYLVAFRPGLLSPTLAAHMAATYQRVSGGRLLLNVVTGGDDVEQQRFGDHLGKEGRYERAGEFLHIVRALWSGAPVTFAGRHYDVRGAQIVPAPTWPEIYLGGSSTPALDVAAKYADVYLTWGEPPQAVAQKLDAVRMRAKVAGRELRFGIRLHVITRDTAAQAWEQAKRLLDGLDPAAIERAQAIQRASQSEGQRRMSALHGGRTDSLEVSPNLWAGVGLVRGGAGTALVGSHEEVAERIAEYYALGIDEFILSGYPHLEEAYQVGEGLIPVLRRRGLMAPRSLTVSLPEACHDHTADHRAAPPRPPGGRAVNGAPTATTARAAILTSAADAITAARAYAASIADGAIARDRAGKVPYPELAALDASGLLAITVPAAYGGPDLSPVVLAEVIRTIAAVDPAIAQIPQAHFLFVDALAVHGSPVQQRRLFADVLAGARLGNGMAERGGKHAQDLKTRLHPGPAGPDGPRLELDGKKYYCTGAISARWIGVSALDEEDRLVLAFVDRHAPGLAIDEDWDVMGQRATVSGTATFDRVPVDPALVVRYASAFEVPQQLGARSQLVHTAIQVGIAGGALRDAREFLRTKARPFFEATRAGWAETAATDPHTVHRFGRLAIQVAAAEALLAAAAATLAEVTRFPSGAEAAARGSIAVAEAKAFASDTAVEVASDLFSLAGASAADERYDLSRHWRNARTHASHDPVDWKYHHVGNYLLNDALPPNHGQL